jgi:alginate O-acetyltransferase complex protein AlgI
VTFDSVTFLLFLPLVYALYWALPTVRAQNALLLVASYVFYGAWGLQFLGLLFLASCVDYFSGLGIARGKHPRAWLALTVCNNLGILLIFKYLDWGITSFVDLMALFDVHADVATLGLVIPVGISFYTFQTLSYGFDVYRGRLTPTRDFVAFLAFVAFFPQLAAGPIERAATLVPQFLRPRRFVQRDAIDGALQMLYGLLLKVLIADRLAAIVAPAYAAAGTEGPWTLLVATWAFAFQIYCDFAGYSHMAIGAARLFGFSLMRNFAYPYFALSPAEFWDRWHISLSTWFRDYLYIPLGGNRAGPIRRRFNVFLTFLVSGIWHGANWTYVAWGAYWGALVALLPRRRATEISRPMGKDLVPSLHQALLAFVMFQVACIGWVLFRAATIGDALSILESFTHLFTTAVPVGVFDPILPILVPFVAWEWWNRHQAHGLTLHRTTPRGRVLTALAVVLLIAAWGEVRTVPFIYFQF